MSVVFRGNRDDLLSHPTVLALEFGASRWVFPGRSFNGSRRPVHPVCRGSGSQPKGKLDEDKKFDATLLSNVAASLAIQFSRAFPQGTDPYAFVGD